MLSRFEGGEDLSRRCPIRRESTRTFSRFRSEGREEARVVCGRESRDLKGGKEAVGEGEEAGEESCQLTL
jgi:hypothetical protein